MGTISNLNYTQKKALRNLYANYKSVREDCETQEERKVAIDEINAEYEREYQPLTGKPIFDIEGIIYSPNQRKFIEDAEAEGLEIDYGYGGRGMYGDVCPSVRCDSHNDLTTKAKTEIDSMGMGIVIYAQY